MRKSYRLALFGASLLSLLHSAFIVRAFNVTSNVLTQVPALLSRPSFSANLPSAQDRSALPAPAPPASVLLPRCRRRFARPPALGPPPWFWRRRRLAAWPLARWRLWRRPGRWCFVAWAARLAGASRVACGLLVVFGSPCRAVGVRVSLLAALWLRWLRSEAVLLFAAVRFCCSGVACVVAAFARLAPSLVVGPVCCFRFGCLLLFCVAFVPARRRRAGALAPWACVCWLSPLVRPSSITLLSSLAILASSLPSAQL